MGKPTIAVDEETREIILDKQEEFYEKYGVTLQIREMMMFLVKRYLPEMELMEVLRLKREGRLEEGKTLEKVPA